MFRLIRITESVEKDDKVDKLIDSVLRIYKNELNDDEVVRLVSNLRKQANEIIRQRKNVDVMINNSETNDGQEDDVDIHDWEDQVTTNKSPVTDDAEIKSADKVSHPDPSSDEIEDDEDTDEESEEPFEDDSDESESEESEPEDEPESDNSDESVDSSEDKEGPEDSPKDSPKDIPEEGSKKSKDKKVKKKPEEEEKSDTEGKEKSKSIKKEGFRLIRIS